MLTVKSGEQTGSGNGSHSKQEGDIVKVLTQEKPAHLVQSKKKLIFSFTCIFIHLV